MDIPITSAAQLQRLAYQIGHRLKGGEVFELVGDVGTGKTTFTKGLADGMGIDDDVQSPSFTISRTYRNEHGPELHHYDFYRLSDPGIMQHDFSESVEDPRVVTVVEWADTVEHTLPIHRTVVRFDYGQEPSERQLLIDGGGELIKEAYAVWHQDRST